MCIRDSVTGGVGIGQNLNVGGLVNISYTGSADSSLQITGYNSKGGTGYHDFLRVTNGYTSATNINKYFRLDSVGTLQILNSAYTATIFSVTDNGQMLIGGGSQGAYVTINGTNIYNINGPYGYLNSGGAGNIASGGSTGNVGFSLQCSGRIQAGEVDVPSDERLKDIQGTIPLDRALQFVRAVDGILYTWKPGFGDEGLKSGFSAQGVYKAGFDHMVVPAPNDRLEVSTDADGFTSPDKFQLTLNYMEAIPYHHTVIKHLLDRIEKLEQLVEKLQGN